jgi:hypothetical protein
VSLHLYPSMSLRDLSWGIHGDHGEAGPIESCGDPRCRWLREAMAERDALVAENERLTYYEFAWRDDFAVVIRDERDRIRAAVEGLDAPVITPPTSPAVQRWYSEGFERAIRDVLALLEADHE